MVAKKKVSPKSQTKKVSPKSQPKKVSPKSQDKKRRNLKRALIGAGVATGVGLLGLAAYKVALSRAKNDKESIQPRPALALQTPASRPQPMQKKKPIKFFRSFIRFGNTKPDEEASINQIKEEQKRQDVLQKEQERHELLQRLEQKRHELLQREEQKRHELLQRLEQKRQDVLQKEQKRRELLQREHKSQDVLQRFKQERQDVLQREEEKRRQKEMQIEEYLRRVLQSGSQDHATMVRTFSSKIVKQLPIEIQLNILEKLGLPDRGVSCASSDQLYQVCKRYFNPSWITNIGKRPRRFRYGTDSKILESAMKKSIRNIDDYISISMMVDYMMKHPYPYKKNFMQFYIEVTFHMEHRFTADEYNKLYTTVLLVCPAGVFF